MMGKQTIFRFDWRILMALAVILQPALSRGAEGDAPQPELTPRNTVIERTGNWLKASQPQQVEPWLDSVSRNSLLSFEQIIVSAVAMSDKTLAEQVDRVRKSSASDLTLLAAEINWSIEDPWIAQNTQLWWASELLQRQLYDEAWQVLSQIDAENIANPATLYYQRAVCAHQLLLPEDTKSSLDSLLALHEIPVRYRALGELMKQDLERWKEKSLGEVSRKMKDVERRLDLGRSGEKVQKVEDEIIETLDELIAKLEEQSNGGSGQGGGSSQTPNAPAQESRVKGQEAPGEVEEKDLGSKDGWGNLPDKDQAKAKQILGTLFPPHYQRAIEAFNKKSAQRTDRKP